MIGPVTAHSALKADVTISQLEQLERRHTSRYQKIATVCITVAIVAALVATLAFCIYNIVRIAKEGLNTRTIYKRAIGNGWDYGFQAYTVPVHWANHPNFPLIIIYALGGINVLEILPSVPIWNRSVGNFAGTPLSKFKRKKINQLKQDLQTNYESNGRIDAKDVQTIYRIADTEMRRNIAERMDSDQRHAVGLHIKRSNFSLSSIAAFEDLITVSTGSQAAVQVNESLLRENSVYFRQFLQWPQPQSEQFNALGNQIWPLGSRMSIVNPVDLKGFQLYLDLIQGKEIELTDDNWMRLVKVCEDYSENEILKRMDHYLLSQPLFPGVLSKQTIECLVKNHASSFPQLTTFWTQCQQPNAIVNLTVPGRPSIAVNREIFSKNSEFFKAVFTDFNQAGKSSVTLEPIRDMQALKWFLTLMNGDKLKFLTQSRAKRIIAAADYYGAENLLEYLYQRISFDDDIQEQLANSCPAFAQTVYSRRVRDALNKKVTVLNFAAVSELVEEQNCLELKEKCEAFSAQQRQLVRTWYA